MKRREKKTEIQCYSDILLPKGSYLKTEQTKCKTHRPFLIHPSRTLCRARLVTKGPSLCSSLKFSWIVACANSSSKYGGSSTTRPPHLTFSNHTQYGLQEGPCSCFSLNSRSQPVPYLCGPTDPPHHPQDLPNSCTSSKSQPLLQTLLSTHLQTSPPQHTAWCPLHT